jgi:dethiobiotin synthetase
MTLCTTETDAAEAVRLGVPADRVLPEVYRLTQPLSPHRAAEIDGVALDPACLVPPDVSPLVIELAGGLMVPLRRDLLQIDLVAQWKLPVVLVARTALGTINHTLLSLEALQARKIMVHGVAFVGDANEDNERTIVEMGGVRALGRLPLIQPTADTLTEAFRENFRCEDFA